MKKVVLSLIIIFSIFCLISCVVPPENNKPWDDLGGGESGEQTEESDITTEDVDKKEEVENPDTGNFETIIDGAVTIDLDSLFDIKE